MKLEARSTPLPWPTLAVEELDGELAVLDEVTGGAHHLNAAATIVWRLLDGTTSLAAIAEAIATAANDEPRHVLDEVVALARDLDARGLLAHDVDQAAVEPPGP